MPKFRTLQDVYNAIPRIECRGLCHESCGPVPAARDEVRAIERAALPGKRFGTDATNHCTMLAAGRCSVYEQRPLLCRLFGVVMKMACPFGCKPERWLSEVESRALLDAAGRLGGGYDMGRLADMLESVVAEVVS